MPERVCEATRYASGPCEPVQPSHDVVYVSAGKETDRHPACFRHGLAEVDRHYSAAGMAQVEMVDAGKPSAYVR